MRGGICLARDHILFGLGGVTEAAPANGHEKNDLTGSSRSDARNAGRARVRERPRMRTIWTRSGWFVVGGALIAACTITTRVQPVPPGTLSSLCIKENEATWSKEFLPTLREQLQRRGIATSVYQGAVPPETVTIASNTM